MVIECSLIAGSDAQGCLVVLIGKNHTLRTDINSEGDSTKKKWELKPGSVPCYRIVMAFDIESDGSYGTIPVHGSAPECAIANEADMAETPVTAGSSSANHHVSKRASRVSSPIRYRMMYKATVLI